MKIRTQFPRNVVEWPDQRITMPDGVELSARIWLPDDANENPVPAILEHLPYRKRDGTIARDQLTHPYFAGHGYACIRVDMRGNGDSEGLMHDEYEQQEWDDAITVMNWVAEQPWSTGDWGMKGNSWGGFNCFQLAPLKPAEMKAVISLCSTTDRYADDIHYKGGCMLGENPGWAAQMLAYSSRPPDPEVVGERWREMWLHRLENQPFLLEPWLRHQRRDTYWKNGSICEDFDGLEAAVLSIGGWHDGYRNTPAAIVRNLNSPAKAIVGPWNHKYPHFAGPEPRIGFLQEALRWWDRWLKDEETGVENDPRERVYIMEPVAPERWVDERPGRWAAIDDDIPAIELSLRSNQTLSDEPGPCGLEIRSPENCGEAGGEYFPFAYGPELPADQNDDDKLSLSFESSLFTEAHDLVGAPAIDLSVTPLGAAAQLAVRLCDIAPDGSAMLIAHGFLNLRHHLSHETSADLTPGERIDVKIQLDQCAFKLEPEHKLRLSISTAYWPFVWPGPENKGVVIETGTLSLPLQDSTKTKEFNGFELPESAPPWNATEIRKPSMTRDTSFEDDGTQVITIVTDNGEMRDNEHGLATGSKCIERWSIHPNDPLSAEVSFDWEETLKRGDWSVRTESQV
ncbi:MAG: CocE/NonD family hydrolase, partial [Boseongicola sp.]|nr:CocE/NonD family hydrolase [Boseongicola sp.]